MLLVLLLMVADIVRRQFLLTVCTGCCIRGLFRFEMAATTVYCWIERGGCEGRRDHLLVVTYGHALSLLRCHRSLALLLLRNKFLEQLTVLEFCNAGDLSRGRWSRCIIELIRTINTI